MRNAAGQGADAFHALGAQELGLDFLPFRDVGIDREDGFGSPFVVANQGPARLDDDLAPHPSSDAGLRPAIRRD